MHTSQTETWFPNATAVVAVYSDGEEETIVVETFDEARDAAREIRAIDPGAFVMLCKAA